MDNPFAGFLWERQFEEVLLELGWGKKCQIGNVCVFIENKDYSYRYTWMPLKKKAGKTAEYGSNMEQIDEQFGS